MERKTFRIVIGASKEKVWDILWDDTTYRAWTAAFAEGSRAVTDWQKGSKVLFVDAKGDGMVAEIADSRPAEFMSIRHLGEIKDGVEDLDPKNQVWSGALENYSLQSLGDQTELRVDMDIAAEYADYFSETWPKALEAVKALAEK
jgi:hypothetical protein